MNKVNKSIGWADYSINPVKGKCPKACPYCYARRMYDRFKWNPQPRLEIETMLDLSVVPSGSKVFVGSTFELFHQSVPHEWLDKIFYFVKKAPWATCIFLTKCPENISWWSPFPENCWIGVSAPTRAYLKAAFYHLAEVKAPVKFVSFEPLLEQPPTATLFACVNQLDWLIIGQQTPVSTKTEPKLEWVGEIVEAAGMTNIPVFLKDNLNKLVQRDWVNGQYALDRGLCNWEGQIRQEWPNGPKRLFL